MEKPLSFEYSYDASERESTHLSIRLNTIGSTVWCGEGIVIIKYHLMIRFAAEYRR